MPNNYFTLTREGSRCILKGFSDGKYIGALPARTGLPGNQNFRTKAQERRGQYEPVPEAVYPLGPLYFAGGKGNYSTMYPAVQSPIWVDIYPERAIGFHLDAGIPGTAGCVGFLNMQDLKTFVSWFDLYGRFTTLYVDWGLGSVKLPKNKSTEKPAQTINVKNGSSERAVLLSNGKTTFTVEDLTALGVIKSAHYNKETKTVTLNV